MTPPDASSTIVVAGATGRQGGAVARRLLEAGWHVRALTRSPDSEPARRLAAAGAEVVRADMNDRASLDGAFAGAHGAFSVQNPAISGVDGEVRQGKHVADAAHAAKLEHVVYGSAGTGAADTGIGWWDSKLAIEAHMRGLGLPLTIVRPVAFMELMTDRDFYPPVSTWHLMPKLAGRRPRGLPMPVWMFNRVASRDLVTMWRWLGASAPAGNSDTLRAIRPESLTVRDWLQRRKASRGQPA